MQRIGIYQNYTPNFKAIYTNPDGSKVNISEKAIAEITHTKIIKKAIDNAYKNDISKFQEYSYSDEMGGQNANFIIDNKGQCYWVPKDYEILYQGETRHGINKANNLPTEFYAESTYSTGKYSAECGAIRAKGSGHKYAYITPDYNVQIINPEWAPVDKK